MFWAGISESDSDDYSPVCSEVDPTDFPLPSTAEDEESLNPDLDKNSDVPSEAELPGFDTTSSTTKQGVVKLVMEIVDLLKTYVKLKPPLPQLGTPELLLRLVKCSDFFDWPHSSAIFDIMDVIYKILESHDYLVPLMQTDFLPAIYYVSKLPQASWCQKCRQFLCIGSSILKKMAKVAESGMGKGNIAHKLLRGDNAMKEQMALAIPYVVRWVRTADRTATYTTNRVFQEQSDFVEVDAELRRSRGAAQAPPREVAPPEQEHQEFVRPLQEVRPQSQEAEHHFEEELGQIESQ
jgi:hypothetical protein